MALKHSKVAITPDDPSAEVKMSDWNADHVVDNTGIDMALRTDVPSSPSSGGRLFGRNIAGRASLSMLGDDGALHTMQSSLGRTRVSVYLPAGNSASITNIGLSLTSGGAGLATRNVATTSFYESLRRVAAVSNGAAGSSTSFKHSNVQWFRGASAGMGGFFALCRFGNSDASAVADARMFVGFRSTTADHPNANPSAQIQLVGVGADSGDANLSIMHNDNTGTATKVPLGANFPANTLNTDVYELALYCPPNASYVNYLVRRLNTGDSVEGQIITDLPTNTQLLAWHLWRNNGTTASAVAIDLISLLIETET